MQEMKNIILLVGDENQTRRTINASADSPNYRIEESDSGKQAVRMAQSIKPDLVLLELGLPDIDGKEVISQIREQSHVPIIALSEYATDEQIVATLDAGADDYVMRPFNADVLRARIKANLRKATVQQAGAPELVNGPIRMDLLRHEVTCNGVKVDLTPKEYKLLRCFMINRGRVMGHKQILGEVWGPAHTDNTQYLRVYVGQVREKLEKDAANPQIIVTAPGVGYRMELLQADVQEEESVVHQVLYNGPSYVAA